MITASFQQQDTNDYALCGMSLIGNVQKRSKKSQIFLPIFFATINATKGLNISFENHGFQPISFKDCIHKKAAMPFDGNDTLLLVFAK